MIQKWQRVEPTSITKVGYRSIVEKTFILPDGRPHSFTTMLDETFASSAIIAITKDKRVVISRQYRPGPERIMDEIPGGAIDANESPQEAAVRELLEETGYAPGAIELLGVQYRDAYCNQASHYFIAFDCEPVSDDQELDTDEYVEVALLSIPEFLENAKSGKMTDAAAVVIAYERLTSL